MSRKSGSHIKVSENADNAWKLEPLNVGLFLLSYQLHSHRLCRANSVTTGRSSGAAPRDEFVTQTAGSRSAHMLPAAED